MRTYLQYLMSDKILAAFFLVISIIIGSFTALAIAQAQTAPAQTAYKLVWSDEYNGSSVDTSKWTVVHQTNSTESHHQGRYLTRNISVSEGNLRIVTERHCIVGSELPSNTNRSNAPCPSGTKTAYSSGQVKSDYNWTEGKVEIRAKMPQTTQSGLWSGFWLRQQGKWCTPQYGEIDILEWYSDPRSTNASTATTHMSCANDKLKSRQHVEHVSGSLADNWHTWGVEWDNTGVTYYLDGKAIKSIASHRPNDTDQDKDTVQDYDGVSQELFDQIMNQPWQLRINTQVYPENDQWHEVPDNAAAFTPQTMLVDYVRVYTKDGNASTTPTAPVATPAEKPVVTPVTTTPDTTQPEQQDKEQAPAPVHTPPTNTPAPQEKESTPAKEAEATPSVSQTSETSRPAPQATDSEATTQPSVASTPVDAATPATLPQTGGSFWPALGSAPFALAAAVGALRYYWRSQIVS